MARKTTPLTDTQIKACKSIDKDYCLFDGLGMYLLVKSSGSKIWRFKYTHPHNRKNTLISFGHYPEVSLQQARKKRDEARELIKQYIDPQEYKKRLECIYRDQQINTFLKVAQDWYKIKSSENLREKTLKDIWRSLENHVFPYIGNTPIKQITAVETIKALEPLRKARKFETIKRACQRINEIMNYAMNIGILNSNPTMKITAAFETSKTQHRPTIQPQELPGFMQALSLANIELQTKCLIEWQLLTMTRPSEAVGAKWVEIDLENNLWVIPADRMKMNREHRVPLSKQALAILSIMEPISGHRDHVFPGMKPPYNNSMNVSTANVAIKRMGYKNKLVAHGLRALASTTLNMQGFDPDIIEAALAHADKNTVRKAYNRATYLEQRKVMLDWWGDFVENANTVSYTESEPCSKKHFNI